MANGPYHPISTPNGELYRKKKGQRIRDGRRGKRKEREYEYYVRFNLEWYNRLEALLDIPANHSTGTYIPGCVYRADVIEKGFKAFLQIDAIARELNYRDVDDLVAHMIEGYRFLQRQGPAPTWLSIEPPPAPPPPRLEPPAT